MKQRNKILALLLAGTMLAGCLTGCGNDSQVNSQGKESSSETSAVGSSQSKENVEEQGINYIDFNQYKNSEEMPDWDGETLELVFWSGANSPGGAGVVAPENPVVENEITRVTGVAIDYENSFDNAGNSFDATIGKIIASNEWPDMAVGLPDMDGLIDMGALYRLDELVQEYAPTVYKIWGPESATYGGEWKRQMETYGGVYSISISAYQASIKETANEGYYDLSDLQLMSAVAAPTTNYGCFKIREDVLLKLYPDALTTEELEAKKASGQSFTEEEIFDIPIETTDDFIQFLYDVKEIVDDMGDPNVAVTYSHEGTDNWPPLVTICKLLGYQGDYFTYYDMEDKTVKYTFKEAWFKDILKAFNQLVRDDVASQESLIDSNAIFKEKMNNGQYIIVNQNQVPANCEIPYRTVWVKYAVSEDKYPNFGTDYASANRWSFFTANLSEEQLIQVLRMFEFQVSDPGQKLGAYGLSENYIDNGDGTIKWNAELEARYLNGEHRAIGKEYGIGLWGYGGVNLPAPAANKYAPTLMYTGNITLGKVYHPGWLYPATINGGSAPNIYASGFTTAVEGVGTFWESRNAFETELQKVFAAADDAAFEAQYEAMVKFAEEKGLTDETLVEINTYYGETVNPDFVNSMK